jgi:hypothetical protein
VSSVAVKVKPAHPVIGVAIFFLTTFCFSL